MDLSVVVTTWRRDAEMLEPLLYTMAWQTDLPREVIVVDTNTHAEVTQANLDLCSRYPLARFIHAPRSPFNLAKGMNVGIKQAQGEYVMATGMEMAFSPTCIETLAKCMDARAFAQAPCGSLPLGVNLQPVNTLGERWESLLHRVISGSNLRISPGTIIVAARAWWHSIKGYDEIHYPFECPDADLARMAHLSHLRACYLLLEQGQVLHQYHEPLRAGYEAGGEFYYAIPEDVVASRPRNPQGWGEG